MGDHGGLGGVGETTPSPPIPHQVEIGEATAPLSSEQEGSRFQEGTDPIAWSPGRLLPCGCLANLCTAT